MDNNKPAAEAQTTSFTIKLDNGGSFIVIGDKSDTIGKIKSRIFLEKDYLCH